MSTLGQMIMDGVASAMPSASIPGRLYFTTDTFQIFRDNGSSWDNVTPESTAVITAIQQQAYVYAADSGSANALAVTLSPVPTIVAGSLVVVKVAHTNTGASTIAVNGGSATAITKNGNTALSGGEFNAGQIIFLVYDGTEYQLIAGSGSGGSSNATELQGVPISATSPTTGEVLAYNGTDWAPASAAGTGTVTSVALTVPSRQSVSGSPITTSGTLAITDNTQTANEVFAGPSSGSSSAPTFRALVPADLPVATTSALGAVKPDGSTIDVSAGVISVPTATTGALGLVKPDGSTITISAGVISSSGGSGASILFGVGDPATSGGTVTPVFVNYVSGSGTSITKTVVEGDLLIVLQAAQVGPATSCSDTLGTSYTELGTGQTESFDNCYTVFMGIAPSGGSNTISTSGAADGNEIVVAEFSGAIATVDAAFATTTGNSSTPTAMSVTTAFANDLIIACICGDGGTYSANSPLTQITQFSNWTLAYLVQSTATTLSVSFSATASTKYAESVVALKANPDGPLPGAEKDIYFDTTDSTYAGYVYHSSYWNPF